jgi:hypothetical protein
MTVHGARVRLTLPLPVCVVCLCAAESGDVTCMPLVGVPDRLNGMCNTFRCTDIPASRVGEVSSVLPIVACHCGAVLFA